MISRARRASFGVGVLSFEVGWDLTFFFAGGAGPSRPRPVAASA